MLSRAMPATRRAAVLSLAEVQASIRDAVVLGATADVAPLLVGGRDPAARLAIHRRHYEASLVEVILRRYPCVVWLLGEPFARAAASDFARWFPPTAPCMAEYAEAFPDFLARRAGVEPMPYVQWVAQLEWYLGQVALAVDEPPLHMEELAAFVPDELPDIIIGVQGGLRFLEAPWPVDDLMRAYLAEEEPDQLLLNPAAVWLQVRGERGRIQIDRLDPATFVFRNAIAQNRLLGAAAEQALDCDPAFDPGGALTALFADGLATSITNKHQEEQP
jgi:uncharacterized protein